MEDFQKSNRDLLEISYIASQATVLSLKSQLAEALQRQALLKERYFERHPQMIEIARTIETLRDQLDKAIQLAIADLERQSGKGPRSGTIP